MKSGRSKNSAYKTVASIGAVYKAMTDLGIFIRDKNEGGVVRE